MKLISSILFGLLLGCASTEMRRFSVTSNPDNAEIDVNGVSAGRTPTEISLKCSKRWVGILNSSDGWAYDSSRYVITAYPPAGSSGYAQTKEINACSIDGGGDGALYFDTRLERVAPTTRIEMSVEHSESKNTPDAKYEESLRSLNQLHASGVLTDEEYKQKLVHLAEEAGK